MYRNTRRVLALCAIAVVAILALWLLAGCGGHSEPGAQTGALTMHIKWPTAAPAGVAPAAIPADTQCLQITLTQGAWQQVVTVKRPTGETTSDVNITGLPIGEVHMHVGAFDDFTEDPDGTVHATGNMLAWAVKDVDVLPNKAAEVNVTLGTTPDKVVVDPGEASTILNVEETLDLTATAYDSEGNILLVAGFTWDTDDRKIATVDNLGKVTAAFPGKTGVNATVGGVTGSLDVRVRGWELWDATPAAGAYRTVVCNGKIYCFGAMATNEPTTQWHVYTPGTKTWVQPPDLPVERFAPALGVIGGKIYLAEEYGEGVNTTYEIDPDTYALTAKATMPTGVSAPAATDFGGKLWLIGGANTSGGASAAVQTYDPSTNTWASKNDFPVAGSLGSAAVFGGDLYVCGLGPYSTPTSAVYRYNVTNDTWSAAPALYTARMALSLGVGPYALYAMGGSTSGIPTGTTVVEALNGSLWRPAPPVPSPLVTWNSGGQAAVDDYLYVIGGTTGAADVNTVYRLWVGDGAL